MAYFVMWNIMQIEIYGSIWIAFVLELFNKNNMSGDCIKWALCLITKAIPSLHHASLASYEFVWLGIASMLRA